MAKSKLTVSEVLRYSTKSRSPATVRRFYDQWRVEQGLLLRCDNPECTLYTGSVEWNGEPISLILDHISGNSKDNSVENLRLLCPNCDSQLPTRGGKNKGRIQNVTESGYEMANRDGTRNARVFLTAAIIHPLL